MDRTALNTQASLSYVEWRVVDMARQDGPRSLNPDGFWARLSRDMFGLPAARGLANEGLEAFRRFCVRAWYWDLIRDSDLEILADAGYSITDARQVLAYVATKRGFTPSIQQDFS